MTKRIKYHLSILLILVLMLATSIPVFAAKARYIDRTEETESGGTVRIAVSMDNLNTDFKDLSEDDYIVIEYSKSDYKAAWNALNDRNYSTVEDYDLNEQTFAAQYQTIWEDYVASLFAGGDTGYQIADHSQSFRNFIVGSVKNGTYDLKEMDTSNSGTSYTGSDDKGDQSGTFDYAATANWINPLDVPENYQAMDTLEEGAGILVYIAEVIGAGVLLVGFMMLMLSMKDDNAETKQRAMKILLTGVLLACLTAVLRAFSIIV